MRRLFLVLLPLVGLLACRRPEVEAFERKPLPIAVSFKVSPAYPRSEDLAKEYADALRARLATRVMVIPAGVPAPAESAELQVEITRIGGHGDPSPGAVGVVTGVAVGALSSLAGNRDAAFDGFFWGMWAGSAAAQVRDEDRHRLGFEPMRVSAEVRLLQRGVADPLDEFDVGGREVIDQMDSLTFRERGDEARIREEEAKAFARVLVSRLQETFHWLPLPEPSFYRPPEPVNPAPVNPAPVSPVPVNPAPPSSAPPSSAPPAAPAPVPAS